ncbi:hypothetical protein YC2023_122586 [Brassica napus]
MTMTKTKRKRETVAEGAGKKETPTARDTAGIKIHGDRNCLDFWEKSSYGLVTDADKPGCKVTFV